MRQVFLTANNIISPLGLTSDQNIAEVAREKSGISQHTDSKILPVPFCASIINNEVLDTAFAEIGNATQYTKLEKMMLLSLRDTMEQANFSISEKTALIVATTKGNIDALGNDFPSERAYLPVLGEVVQTFFGFKNEPIVVSNACVSGLLAIAIAKRLIQNEFYENAFIVAGDIVSKFTLSGFNAFQAISDTPCRPYSKNRNGITIGEAAASAAITSQKTIDAIEIAGDGSSNDANHISGPSRTGEGLYNCVQSAMREAQMISEDIDLISAHGTATLYNDEMEAIAFNRSKLEETPLHSLKGYYGHTLGASGLLEAIVGVHAMKNNTYYTSLGMDELGVSKPLQVITQVGSGNIRTCLKTASGFGGCNTAVVFKKSED